MSHIQDVDYEHAGPDIRQAYDAEMTKRGRVTNMKLTLLNSMPAYTAYMGWYPLWDRIEALVGGRAAAVFAHAISARNSCVLCTVYFRRALSEAGLSPDAFEPTADEHLLIALAEAVVADPNAIGNEMWTRLKARFSDRDIVDLVGFAGMMIAVNVFNSALGVAIDKDLESFIPSSHLTPSALLGIAAEIAAAT